MQAMGSKDDRPAETKMILSTCQKATLATDHKGDRKEAE